MAEITAAKVKELREKTGAGMMDAKKALVENNGDMDAAVDWLRTKGLAKAAKKSGRTAAEGLVAIAIDGTQGAVVEINSETDFVARNEEFQKFVTSVAGTAQGVQSAEELAERDLGGKTVAETLTDLIATIGENMTLRRAAQIKADSVAAYIHSAEAPGMGKIGVLVGLNGSGDLAEAGKKVAMHVAATSPASATVADLDQELVAREKQVLTEQAEQSGKPANVIEKMIEGRIKKFYKEVVLVEQQFVMNPDQTVGQFIADSGAELAGFVMFKLGDGIEKAEDNFADEVASMTKA